MRPDEIVRKILNGRGIASEEEISEFLSDKPKLTHDPFLIPDMEEGADFLLSRLSAGKRICVYGDYDVDGICGTALLVSFLREAAREKGSGSEITYYIPQRASEGYGLNSGALSSIKEGGADTVVTVDCGSVSAEEAVHAKSIGLDILITDHHDPDQSRLPDCLVINPKINKGPVSYPFENLSGAGVAFKLCTALQRLIETDTVEETLRKHLRSMVDLVCIATVADVVPLVDENRTFVKYGLNMLRKGSRQAIEELLSVSGAEASRLSVRDIAYVLSPRINALGRLGDATKGVEFFLTEDTEKIREIAWYMHALNSERRRIQEECYSKCMDQYIEGLDGDGQPPGRFLVFLQDGCYEGVAGIVAGKILEETGYPCAVLTRSQEEDGILKGSARSGSRLDLISLLKENGDIFERCGGHSAAAGFTIRAENEELLRNRFSSVPDVQNKKPDAELELEISDITMELADAIEEIAPFGSGNPKPLLKISSPAGDMTGIHRIGRDKKHLKFFIGRLSFIYFGGSDTAFPEEGNISFLGCPDINEWKGKREIQFAVEHVDVL